MEAFLVVDLNSNSSTVTFSSEICKIPEGPDDEDGDGFCEDQQMKSPKTLEKPHCSDHSEENFRDPGPRTPMDIHTEEGSYLCDQCDKRFKRKSHLKSHQCVHTGENSYYCDLCRKGFIRPYLLKRYQQGHAHQQKATQQ